MLDSTRKGEIAHALLKEKLLQEGMTIGTDFRSELGALATRTKIPPAELQQYVHGMLLEIFTEVSNPDKPLTKEELEGDCHSHGHGGH